MTKRKHRQGSGPGKGSTDWAAERTLADAERDALEQSSSLERVDPEEWAGEETAQEIPPLQQGLPVEDRATTLPGDLGRTDESAAPQPVRCACGGEEFMLQAFMAVVRGRLQPVPLEVESLTCPQCGREYEAIALEGGRVVRGGYLGQTSLDDGPDDE